MNMAFSDYHCNTVAQKIKRKSPRPVEIVPWHLGRFLFFLQFDIHRRKVSCVLSYHSPHPPSGNSRKVRAAPLQNSLIK